MPLFSGVNPELMRLHLHSIPITTAIRIMVKINLVINVIGKVNPTCI